MMEEQDIRFISDNLDTEWRAPLGHRAAVRAFDDEKVRDKAMKSLYGRVIPGREMDERLKNNYIMEHPEKPGKFVLFDPPGADLGEFADSAKTIKMMLVDPATYTGAGGALKQMGAKTISRMLGQNIAAATSTEAVNSLSQVLAAKYVQEHGIGDFDYDHKDSMGRLALHAGIGIAADAIPWIGQSWKAIKNKFGLGRFQPRQEDIDAARQSQFEDITLWDADPEMPAIEQRLADAAGIEDYRAFKDENDIRVQHTQPTSLGMATGSRELMDKEIELSKFHTNLGKLEKNLREFDNKMQENSLSIIDALQHTPDKFQKRGVLQGFNTKKDYDTGIAKEILASEEWKALEKAKQDAFRANSAAKAGIEAENAEALKARGLLAPNKAENNLQAAQAAFDARFGEKLHDLREQAVLFQIMRSENYREPNLAGTANMGYATGDKDIAEDFKQIFMTEEGVPTYALSEGDIGKTIKAGFDLRQTRLRNIYTRMHDYFFELATNPQGDIGKKASLAVSRKKEQPFTPDMNGNEAKPLVADSGEVALRFNILRGKIAGAKNKDPLRNTDRDQALDILDDLQKDIAEYAQNGKPYPLTRLHNAWKTLTADMGDGDMLGTIRNQNLDEVREAIGETMMQGVDDAIEAGTAPEKLDLLRGKMDTFYTKTVADSERFRKQMLATGGDADLFRFIMRDDPEAPVRLRQLKNEIPAPHFDMLRGSVIQRMGYADRNGNMTAAFSPELWAENWLGMSDGVKNMIMHKGREKTVNSRSAMDRMANVILKAAEQRKMIEAGKASGGLGNFLAQPLVAGSAVGVISALSGAQFGTSTAAAFASIYGLRTAQAKLRTWQMDFLLNPESRKWLAESAKLELGTVGQKMQFAGGHLARLGEIASRNPELGPAVAYYMDALSQIDISGAMAAEAMEDKELGDFSAGLSEELEGVPDEYLVEFLRGASPERKGEIMREGLMSAGDQNGIGWLNP